MKPPAGPEEAHLAQIAEQVSRITAENARLLQGLAETERRFHRVSRGVLRAQEEERSRISRDLHDGVGQSLTALKIQLELLEREATGGNESLATQIRSARELAASCLAEVRELSHLLRPQMLDDLGLLPTLRWLTRTVQKRTGIEVTLEISGEEARIDPDVETLLFRLVQEALTNVVKHARASSARVLLSLAADQVSVRIQDEGVGFDADSILAARDEEGGFGVRAMRDRVQSFRGRFALRSGPGSTTLEAEIPLSKGGPR